MGLRDTGPTNGNTNSDALVSSNLLVTRWIWSYASLTYFMIYSIFFFFYGLASCLHWVVVISIVVFIHY